MRAQVEDPRERADFIGMTSVDLLQQLPTLPWQVCVDGQFVGVHIHAMYLACYDRLRQNGGHDHYRVLRAQQGEPIDSAVLKDEIRRAAAAGMTVGLNSRVQAFLESDKALMDPQTLHIPMLDIDDPEGIFQAHMIAWIREQIRQETELEHGVIIASGGRHRFHFIGTGRLLTTDEYRIFLAHCQAPSGHGARPIGDVRWIGHSLDAMRYLCSNRGISIYAYPDSIYGTLRLTAGGEAHREPRVVAIL